MSSRRRPFVKPRNPPSMSFARDMRLSGAWALFLNKEAMRISGIKPRCFVRLIVNFRNQTVSLEHASRGRRLNAMGGIYLGDLPVHWFKIRMDDVIKLSGDAEWNGTRLTAHFPDMIDERAKWHMTLGEYLRGLRARYGYTQRQMARVFGVSRMTYAFLEHNRVNARRYFIARLRQWQRLDPRAVFQDIDRSWWVDPRFLPAIH